MIKVLEKYKKRIDIPLLAITFFIIFMGLVTLSGSNLDTSNIIINQVINIFIGLIILILTFCQYKASNLEFYFMVMMIQHVK